MKEKVIETAWRTWKTLAEKGETNIAKLPTMIKEKDFLVYQALGWLAREDKITYRITNSATFVALIENELQAFKNSVENVTQTKSIPAKTKRTVKKS